jgi:hypothetical protein
MTNSPLAKVCSGRAIADVSIELDTRFRLDNFVDLLL